MKSCAGFSVGSWPLSNKGLLYDREWMVLSRHNSVLSQKQEPNMCLVQPSVDIEGGRLTLNAEGHGSVELPLATETDSVVCVSPADSRVRHVSWSSLVRVCGDR